MAVESEPTAPRGRATPYGGIALCISCIISGAWLLLISQSDGLGFFVVGFCLAPISALGGVVSLVLAFKGLQSATGQKVMAGLSILLTLAVLLRAASLWMAIAGVGKDYFH